MANTFTRDGSPMLENRLDKACSEVREAIRQMIPEARMSGLLLGGGYGRGEGGVLKTASGDQPYNDLEFYLFLSGNRHLNLIRYGNRLTDLSSVLSKSIGIHVEFKLEELGHFKRSKVSMYSYDLVCGHRVVHGRPDILAGCTQRHSNAALIPVSEATRLLLNRCTGLLLARDEINKPAVDRDFVARNVAKLRLALGDAVLTAHGQYHWSCIERSRRLQAMKHSDAPPEFESIRAMHTLGVDFKLHPHSSSHESVAPDHALSQMSSLALSVWLWIESRRLAQPFHSVEDYVLDTRPKYFETPVHQNWLCNLRSFGLAASLDPLSFRYPRERLFSALPLLLAERQCGPATATALKLKRSLRSSSTNRTDLLEAYLRLWPHYS